MKSQHHPIDERSYSTGIKSDVNKELLGLEDGADVDAVNMRTLPMDGDNYARKKIRGESLLYPAIDNRCIGGTGAALSAGYHCMKSIEIQDHIIEVWADEAGILDPFVRVDGKIVIQSVNLPIQYTFPIQADKNENCNGGEFYLTNNQTPPMVFSLKDLMLNSGMTYGSETGACTTKYFEDFNINEYTVNIDASLYKPAFIKTVSGTTGSYSSILGAAGLVVGSYSYSYRYVSPAGDRTNFSPITELVPVVRTVSDSFSRYPSIRTFSSDPDISNPTLYGNHIRIRYENNLGFEFIEVRRDSWFNGDAIGSPPVSEIIGSINIVGGVEVLDILDRCGPEESQEILTLDDQTNQLSSIQRAKTLRYFNERLYLMNVGYQSKDVDADVALLDPLSPGFATIQKIGKKGHKNTYNAAHYKSNMRGEKISTAIILYDGANSSSYAKEIESNFQFPNRRDIASADTIGTSYYDLVTAANVSDTVTKTHEVFDHLNAVTKNDRMTANILNAQGNSYNAMNPVSQNDTVGNDLADRINIECGTGQLIDNTQSYNPRGFELDYYAMGYTFKGIDTTTQPLPSWASGFSVVQTQPANRVIAQGMGYYKLNNLGGTFGANTTKEVNRFHVYFPDLDDNIGLNTQIIDTLLANPGSYQLQLVSPLGFFTEVYSYLNNVGNDEAADIITYNRVLRENGDINPTANPSNAGINGYTSYGRWRSQTQLSPVFGTSDGNTFFNISAVSEVTNASGVGKYLEITVIGSVYGMYGAGGAVHENDQSVKDWQEPMYVVNLVNNAAAINQGLTTQYKYTGHYVKFDSIVYQVSAFGVPNFSTTLVSERWEDCIPTLTGQINNAYAALYRFVFVKDDNGLERRWLNIHDETTAFTTQVLTDITANGFSVVTDASGSYNVYGVYSHTESTDDTARIQTLDFNWFDQTFNKDFMVPPALSQVIVRYDNRIPVRVFGGDTYINESVWALKDIPYNKNADLINSGDEFKMNIAFPYGSYYIPASVTIAQNTQGLNRIQDNNPGFRFSRGTTGASIRQLLSMWTAETRINLSFAFNDEGVKHSLQQFFPLKNYVMRPYKWNDNSFGSGNLNDIYVSDNNMFSQYGDDYDAEFNNWGLGGFRFQPQVNIDYSKGQTTQLITSVPSVGFDEQTDYCTRIVWSEKRPVNAQNTPTVRTFPPGNFYDISDDTGEIKFGWSAISAEKGNNLYAFTDSGICLLLVDKRIIHEINADELATVGSDIGGILNQLWIERTIGMSDETWRSFAEYSNAVFWMNYTSMYVFGNNQAQDVGSTGFKDILIRSYIPELGTGYSADLSGGYNILNQEYMVTTKNVDHRTLIYGVQQKALQCRSDYDYDSYLYIDNKLYGMKDAKTYELGIGNTINGIDMEASITGVSDKQTYSDKEFIRIRVNSNSKPERIEFYDSYPQYLSGIPSSVVDSQSIPLAIKDYYGYECYIPRKSVAPFGRQQGRVLLFKIISTTNENFLVTSTGVQYKPLK